MIISDRKFMTIRSAGAPVYEVSPIPNFPVNPEDPPAFTIARSNVVEFRADAACHCGKVIGLAVRIDLDAWGYMPKSESAPEVLRLRKLEEAAKSLVAKWREDAERNHSDQFIEGTRITPGTLGHLYPEPKTVQASTEPSRT